MILEFKDEGTADLFNGLSSKKALKWPKTLWPAAQRKLDMLNAAHELEDLHVPPGNRLEALEGHLRGLHSIRINDQFRLIFRWKDHNANEVRIDDYH